MKRFNKILVCALSSVFMASSLVGCAGGQGSTSKGGNLNIRIVNTGYGVDFLYDIAAEFERLYDCTVEITESVEPDQELSKYAADYTMDDLFFCTGTNGVWNLIKQKKFIEIDDVWDAVCDGESVKIKDKTLPYYRDYSYVYGGHYYSIPINIGMGGFVYNKTSLDKMFGENEWKLPNTSTELYNLACQVKEKGHWAFSWSTKCPYWGCATMNWEAQYNGLETQNHYNAGEYYDVETDSWKFSKNAEVIKQNKGVLKRIKALDKMVDKSQGLSSQYCADMDFMQAQMSFAGLGFQPADSKLVAFAPNGAWLLKENESDFKKANSEIGIFSVVMSSCVEKLSFYKEKNANLEITTEYEDLPIAQQEKYDKCLSKIIEYIDGGMQGVAPNDYDGLTILKEDVALVKEMRSMRQIDFQANAVIPNTATNKDLAKEFLKFYCSDYAGEIYIDGAKSFSPFYYKNIDSSIIDKLTLFEKDVYKMLQGDINVEAKGGEGFTVQFTSRLDGGEWFDRTQADMANKRTAEEFWQKNYVDWNLKNWHSTCAQANLSDKLNG